MSVSRLPSGRYRVQQEWTLRGSYRRVAFDNKSGPAVLPTPRARITGVHP